MALVFGKNASKNMVETWGQNYLITFLFETNEKRIELHIGMTV
jgi:hypothetical protein